MLYIHRNITFYEFAFFNQINSLSTIYFFLSFKNRQKRTTLKNILIQIIRSQKRSHHQDGINKIKIKKESYFIKIFFKIKNKFKNEWLVFSKNYKFFIRAS